MEETAPIMTKYEFTRIKGIRIQQLIDGFPPFVDVNPDDKEEDTFKKELVERKIPLKVTRPCGYKKFVEIPVSKMDFERFT